MSAISSDVAIIGAGPVGIFAVFALGQLGLSSIVVDALHEAGGQCAALYPEKPIYDIPSRPSVSGAGLIDDLLRQSEPYAPAYRLGRRVETLRERDGRYELGLSDGTQIEAGAVLVAAGAGAFGPNRPPLDGIEAYEGHSVFYSVRTAERFRGKRVVIAGGGDSAADWAVFLADIAASVTLVHRRPVFRAAPGTVAALERL
ncbi:MAG TPA: NAD(P)/FAD-dependent oxidoreductase, partial [Ancylobacter sp.]